MPKIVERPEVGCLLVAEPFLGDPNFEQSVILITAHDHEGTVGFNLCERTSYTMRDAVVNFPKIEVPLFKGGPVMNDNLYFLHTRKDLIKNGINVGESLVWGGDPNTLFQAIEQGYIHPSEYRFFSGYSGWSGGQLEKEIQEKSWVILVECPQNLLSIPFANLWKELINSLGGDYPLWAQAPKNPDWN